MKFKFSHVSLFLLGISYYFLVPLLFGFFSLLTEFPGMSLFFAHFNKITNTDMLFFIGYSFFLMASFCIGSKLCSFKRDVNIKDYNVPVVFSKIIFISYVGMFLVFINNAKSLLFSGYSVDYDSSLMGPLATLNMFLLYSYLVSIFSVGKYGAKLFGFLLALNSLALLSMGGRMYVVLVFVSIFVSQSVDFNRKENSGVNLSSIFATGFVIIFVGMWRLGTADFSLIGYFLAAEAVFTSISMFSFYLWNSILYINVPIDFFSSIVNIVPSFVLPNKALYIRSIADLGYMFDSPLGALSFFVSLVANFGLFFSGVYLCAVGAVLSYLSRLRHSPLGLSLYSYLCGIVPFMMFRDPFSVQLKVVITGFLLFLFYYICCSILNKIKI